MNPKHFLGLLILDESVLFSKLFYYKILASEQSIPEHGSYSKCSKDNFYLYLGSSFPKNLGFPHLAPHKYFSKLQLIILNRIFERILK